MRKKYREFLDVQQPVTKVNGVDAGLLKTKPGATDNIKQAEGDQGASKTDN
jgi:hypothetical protein